MSIGVRHSMLLGITPAIAGGLLVRIICSWVLFQKIITVYVDYGNFLRFLTIGEIKTLVNVIETVAGDRSGGDALFEGRYMPEAEAQLLRRASLS